MSRGSARRRELAALVIALMSVAALGCASTHDGARRGLEVDATGGITVEMFVESGGARFELYRVERSGLLRFAGGIAARTGSFSWSGPLSPDEIARLRGEIERHRWFEEEPPSVPEPRDRLYRIEIVRLAAPGRNASFIVTGDSPAVKPAYDLLRGAALRRNDEFLRTLPQPGDAP